MRKEDEEGGLKSRRIARRDTLQFQTSGTSPLIQHVGVFSFPLSGRFFSKLPSPEAHCPLSRSVVAQD